MTDAAGVAAHARRGYGMAARRLGRTCAIYRPYGVGNPIASANLAGTVFAAFDQDTGFRFNRAVPFGAPLDRVMMDATLAEVGDYLVSEDATRFMATRDDFSAPVAVICNRVVTLKRPDGGTAGAGYYGGDVRANEVPVLTSWPASIIQAGRSGANEVGLPGDVGAPRWTILLPASVPGQIRSSDVIEDDQAQPMRYIVSSAEQTAMGWRLAAQQAVA